MRDPKRREFEREHYEKMLKLWMQAEEAAVTGKAYTIGSRSLTRYDLDEILKMQNFYRQKLAELEVGAGIVRVYGRSFRGYPLQERRSPHLI